MCHKTNERLCVLHLAAHFVHSNNVVALRNAPSDSMTADTKLSLFLTLSVVESNVLLTSWTVPGLSTDDGIPRDAILSLRFSNLPYDLC